MADRPRSLDIDDFQVIVEFAGDDEEFRWHHRVALHRLGPERWVMLTPDFNLEVVDLSTQSYRLLARHANFPQGLANQIYAFAPLHPPTSSATRSLPGPTRPCSVTWTWAPTRTPLG